RATPAQADPRPEPPAAAAVSLPATATSSRRCGQTPDPDRNVVPELSPQQQRRDDVVIETARQRQRRDDVATGPKGRRRRRAGTLGPGQDKPAQPSSKINLRQAALLQHTKSFVTH